MLKEKLKLKIINGPKEIENLDLTKVFYPWAREHYLNGVANNWVPQEISMIQDCMQWENRFGKDSVLTPQEQKLILLNLGFFSTAEILTADNLAAIYQHITDIDARKYIGRQIYEEMVHTETFSYCCDSLGLDKNEVFKKFQTIPSIKEKDEFVINLTKSILNPNFNTKGADNIRLFLHDLIGYYVIMEGIFFYAGFAMMLSLKRKNKMIGIGEQFEYIMRDESVHLAFGCDLINTIKEQNPEAWTEEFEKEIIELIKKSVELEKKYAIEACPDGIVGINALQFCQYVEYVSNRRLHRIGLKKLYFDQSGLEIQNPFPWMSTATDLLRESNFFEKKVTEYRSRANLDWDEEEENLVKKRKK
jgi:ribonucleoside-diphosphate reductase beta chain